MHVNDLLKTAVEAGASDLHCKVGSFPMMRVRGSLMPASEEKRLDHEDMLAMAAAVLPTAHRERFKEHHEVDLAYSVTGLGRFRCNAFQQRFFDIVRGTAPDTHGWLQYLHANEPATSGAQTGR